MVQMGPFLLIWAGILCGVTALVHSVLGEKRVVVPLLREAHGVMDAPLARQVTRFAWHWMSVLWLLVGAVLVVTAYGTQLDRWLVIAIGAAHATAGIVDAIYTRGRHVGWPLITLIGALTLLAVFAFTPAEI